MSIANRSVYPAITSILRIYLDNTPLYTPRVLCFFIHNDSIHDSSFGDQTALDVNKNIFPCKSGYKSQANPSSVNQDSISLPFSLSLSARLIPFMGPFQEAGPCFIDSIMKHLDIKRMPTCSQQVARLSMNRSQLYLRKSSKKKKNILQIRKSGVRRVTMDVKQPVM